MKKSLVLIMLALPAVAAVTPAEFVNPPREYGPCVWWHWMNGNVTQEGITGDLEAMAAAGVCEATMFDASCDIPKGPVTFGTPEYFDNLRHACKEANRLGVKISIANGTGWANSGGPWVKPEDSMKYVTVSETPVTGPSRFVGKLPRIAKDNGFYRDIAVLAVKGRNREIPCQWSTQENVPVITSRPEDLEFEVKAKKGNVTTVTCAQPVTAAGFSWRIEWAWHCNMPGLAEVEVSDDGVNFRPLETFPFHVSFFNTQFTGLRHHTFRRPVTFKALRFITRCDWKIKLAEFHLETLQYLTEPEGKCYRYKMPIRPTVIDEVVTAVKPEATVWLTDRMAADGTLDWEVPAGDWTILRVGYYANGKLVSSSGTAAGRGPEVDKLAVAPVERHFEAYVGKLMRFLGEDGKAIVGVLNDSFEAESQNWTDGLDREFELQKGYSLLPYLPAFTGRIVNSVAETERFLADFRDVINELFCRNYAGTMLRKAHEYGLKFYLEPYGNGPFREKDYARYCDMPMTEFWSRPYTDKYWMSTGPNLGYVEQVAEAADEWGHRILGAEAFTASAGYGRWQVQPYSIKCQLDHVYELGVNRIFFHRFTHQPWRTPKLPGMTMGPWGMHLDRTQTWWGEAPEFFRYMSRCQYMLQQGCKVKDDLCHRRDPFADWYFVTSTNHRPVRVEKVCAITGRVPELWYPETGETVVAADWRVENGKTVVAVDLPTAGSAFVVFRTSQSELPRERRLAIKAKLPVTGPWTLRFHSPLGDDPAPLTTDRLFDWKDSAVREIRYFSGSADYETEIAVPAAGQDRVWLDLGEVRDFATVTVNGKRLRTLWKPPFAVDITEAIAGAAGKVKLSVRITNRWPNRLIGDDFLPENERKTWSSWHHWSKRDQLLESGLLGPVTLKIHTVKERQTHE